MSDYAWGFHKPNPNGGWSKVTEVDRKAFEASPEYLAVQIQRRFPREKWAAHIAALPEDKREGAAAYLRDIWLRMQLFVPRDAK